MQHAEQHPFSLKHKWEACYTVEEWWAKAIQANQSIGQPKRREKNDTKSKCHTFIVAHLIPKKAAPSGKKHLRPQTKKHFTNTTNNSTTKHALDTNPKPMPSESTSSMRALSTHNFNRHNDCSFGGSRFYVHIAIGKSNFNAHSVIAENNRNAHIAINRANRILNTIEQICM